MFLAGVKLIFFHNIWHGSVFWICDEDIDDNKKMFFVILSKAYTESRPFLPFNPSHQLGSAQGAGRGDR